MNELTCMHLVSEAWIKAAHVAQLHALAGCDADRQPHPGQDRITGLFWLLLLAPVLAAVLAFLLRLIDILTRPALGGWQVTPYVVVLLCRLMSALWDLRSCRCVFRTLSPGVWSMRHCISWLMVGRASGCNCR